MNATEAAALCRLAKAYCPQQALDEYTPDAWHDLLGHVRFTDAKEALAVVARRQPFVAPSEILAAVRQLREKRLRDFGPIDVPAGLEPAEYRAYLAQATRAVANGDQPRLALPPAPPAVAPAVHRARIRALVHEVGRSQENTTGPVEPPAQDICGPQRGDSA